MRFTSLLLCVLMLVVGWFAGHSLAEDKPAAKPAKFEQLQVVWLRRSDRSLDLTRAQRAELGRKHIAHMRTMAQASHLLVTGPFGEKDDSVMREMCIYRASSMEDARKLAAQDPAVSGGLFDAVCATWYVEAGNIKFPNEPTDVPDEPDTSDKTKADKPSTGIDQSSPQALAESIFACARTGDLKSLAPIAATGSDGDSKRVASVASASAKDQAEFTAYFAPGKVSGDVVMNGDKASVPILFGPGASRKETLEMVKQADGKWYLQSF